jgi:hypothetical protein
VLPGHPSAVVRFRQVQTRVWRGLLDWLGGWRQAV